MKRLDATRWHPLKPEPMLRNYERVFEPLVARGDVRLLELGVWKGASLAMWADYFEGGTIAGLDINKLDVAFGSPMVKVYQGDQTDIGSQLRAREGQRVQRFQPLGPPR